jgi:2-keto-3-deoxy-L-rhamnonate aldolase RhmA
MMFLKNNFLKEKLRNGDKIIGTFVKLLDPAATEILSLAGFDFLIFDMEHSPIDTKSLENMTRACLLGGAVPLARVTVNRPENILTAMDVGLYGVQIPHVDTPEDARRAVSSVKYRLPRGDRGLALSQRSAGYGSMLADEYIEWVEGQTLIVVQIESVSAYESLPEILKTDGVDVAFFGPMDLSQSLGVPGQTDSPAVKKILVEAPKIISKYPNKQAGIWVSNLDDLKRFYSIGYRYFAIGSDTAFLNQRAKSIIQQVSD